MENTEYTFFSTQIAQQFRQQSLLLGANACELDETFSPMGGDLVVTAKVEIAESQLASVEALYEELFFENQAAEIEGNDEQGAIADACGVQLCLQNGQFTTIAIHPDIMNKILSVLSIDELQSFLAQVAEDIENPKSAPICARQDLPKL